VIYRETGQFKTTYASDQQLFPILQDRIFVIAFLVFAFGLIPFVATEYLLRAILVPFLILSLAAIGLNILVGYCGQVSLGTGGFMAIGAYAAVQPRGAHPGPQPARGLPARGRCAPRWSGRSSASRACASRGSTSRSPPSRPSSSSTGCSRA
jgi:branched-chain amino acid transport system permease protein